MATIVGLDLSLTSAGIAILVDGKPKLIRSVGHTGRDGASWQHRSRRVRSQCQAVLKVIVDGTIGYLPGARNPDLAVIEGPSYASQFGDHFDRAALWHGVYGALEARGVPIAVVAPNSLKLWWTGAGDATKLRMLDTARARFREAISDDDQADAVALACAGAWRLGDPIPFEPGERQLGALEKIEWPVSV